MDDNTRPPPNTNKQHKNKATLKTTTTTTQTTNKYKRKRQQQHLDVYVIRNCARAYNSELKLHLNNADDKSYLFTHGVRTSIFHTCSIHIIVHALWTPQGFGQICPLVACGPTSVLGSVACFLLLVPWVIFRFRVSSVFDNWVLWAPGYAGLPRETRQAPLQQIKILLTELFFDRL